MPNKYWTDDPDETETGSGRSYQTSDPDITEPDENSRSIPTRSQTPQSQRRTHPPQQLQGGISAQITTSKGRTYKDPDIDTTERLSDIDPNFNRAEGTKKLKERVIDRWHRFCRKNGENESDCTRWSDPENALRQASADCIFQFLKWCFKLEYGTDGRKLPGYGQAGTFNTDWKYFRIYYEDILGHKMDKDMVKSLRTARQWLIHENKLGTQSRDNDPVYIDDMIEFNETILQTRKKRFYLGIQRIMLCLALMLGLFTAGRKTAILKLQYKHLRISLLRNPHGGPPILDIAIKPKYIKSLLGITNLNTFSFPEIILGVSLVFSPHVFIMGLLLHARAFQANIRSMDDVRRLFVMRNCQELPLPLKEEMDNYYLFCKVDLIDGKPWILRDQPMSDSQYNAAIRAISEIMGLLKWFFFHQFRYGTGKILDKTEWVSDSERNLILNHANTSTFLKYYRPRNHTQMQQAVLGLDPNEVIDRALTSIRRYADKRRPRYLDDTQKALVEDDPELQTAISNRDALLDQFQQTPDATLAHAVAEAERNIKNTRQRLRYRRKKEVRRAFSDEQAVKDANAQLSGTNLLEDELNEELDDDTPPEQTMLIEGLMAVPVEWTFEGEWQRRNVGTEVIIMYCDYEEGGPLRGRPKGKRRLNDEVRLLSVETKQIEKTEDDKPIIEKKRKIEQEQPQTAKKPLVCFQCGKKYRQTDRSELGIEFRDMFLIG
ncbi:hypothetical protein UA08_09463 [Talaromyces atroroseus]|uniref:Uncharacterized protein n=1 Tax=Talaromyces atroroseus TaxID=1441469 RepID=A0A225AEK1_TALAT|nr:hypothetical protein UA08_09463 [Talaromyces atroroseus]OKL55298.1 hypothetical protein UA08_09463 [Talaromyces atroroseus]